VKYHSSTVNNRCLKCRSIRWSWSGRKTVTFLAVKDKTKIAIKILRGSAVTQKRIRHLFANFLWYISAENNENWLTCVKVMSKDKADPFWDTMYIFRVVQKVSHKINGQLLAIIKMQMAGKVLEKPKPEREWTLKNTQFFWFLCITTRFSAT